MNSIFHRISVRKYEDKPVEKEKIMQILKAGMQAPSACNQQPWEFYVVTDKEKIQELRSSICADRYVDCPGKYLAGNGCAWSWRRMVRHCTK